MAFSNPGDVLGAALLHHAGMPTQPFRSTIPAFTSYKPSIYSQESQDGRTIHIPSVANHMRLLSSAHRNTVDRDIWPRCNCCVVLEHGERSYYGDVESTIKVSHACRPCSSVNACTLDDLVRSLFLAIRNVTLRMFESSCFPPGPSRKFYETEISMRIAGNRVEDGSDSDTEHSLRFSTIFQQAPHRIIFSIESRRRVPSNWNPTQYVTQSAAKSYIVPEKTSGTFVPVKKRFNEEDNQVTVLLYTMVDHLLHNSSSESYIIRFVRTPRDHGIPISETAFKVRLCST